MHLLHVEGPSLAASARQPAQRAALRGDARWVGFHRARNGDQLVALSAARGLYAAVGMPRMAAEGGGGAPGGGGAGGEEDV